MVDGWPTVLPVNYALDGEDIVIRTDAGTKLRALRHGAQVSVQIDAVDPLYRSGWSVLAFGYGQEVSDEADLSRTRSLPLQSWAVGRRTSGFGSGSSRSQAAGSRRHGSTRTRPVNADANSHAKPEQAGLRSSCVAGGLDA
jgi:hypothetical protein